MQVIKASPITFPVEVRLLDTFPHAEGLSPAEVIALGGFGTVSPEDFLEMVRELDPQERRKRVKDILEKAIIRGYASMTTSTALLFSIKGSRILDLYITAYPFGSYMVLSQRFVPVERPEVPKWVGNDVKDLLKEEIKVYKKLTEMGIRREEARGVLGLGTPTHMLAVLPVESVASMVKWGGEHREIREFLERMRREVERSDAGDLFRATLNAPTMGGPFPHPFHRNRIDVDDLELVDYTWNGETDGVKKFREEVERIRRNPPKDWKEMVENTVRLSKIAYAHATEFSALLRVKIPLTTFNELKRHRTIIQRVEGIYPAMERGEFYVYPTVKNVPEAKELYIWVIEEFRGLDAPEEERIYALPQSVKVGVELLLPFHQLTAPSLFYRMRSCDRAEVSMKQWVRRIPYILRSVPTYGELLFDVLTSEVNGSRLPLPKCVVGACPEPEFCPLIRGIREYDEDVHKIIKKSRKEGLHGG